MNENTKDIIATTLLCIFLGAVVYHFLGIIAAAVFLIFTIALVVKK